MEETTHAYVHGDISGAVYISPGHLPPHTASGTDTPLEADHKEAVGNIKIFIHAADNNHMSHC
jgi:hypothetical protein